MTASRDKPRQSDSSRIAVSSQQGSGFFSPPQTFGHLLALIGNGWLALVVVLLGISWTVGSTPVWSLGLGLIVLFTCIVLQQVWKLLRARMQVLDRKDVPLLWGFVRLISWNPIEGVLVLKNKAVHFFDDDLHDGEGGIRFIYPLLGEELALRVPLEVQTLQILDKDVLTRDYLRIDEVRGTLKWRIVDVQNFYLQISRKLHSTGDTIRSAEMEHPRDAPSYDTEMEKMFTSAIEWLRMIAEEQTRRVLSQSKTGLLIADRLSQELPEMFGSSSEGISRSSGAQRETPVTDPVHTDVDANGWGEASSGLAGAIHHAITQRLGKCGIVAEDVTLEEIRLPEDIMQECIAAAKGFYTTTRARREASVKYANRQAELLADVELLGREAVGTREVVGSAKSVMLQDFLSLYLAKKMGQGASDKSPALEAGLIAGQITNAASGPAQVQKEES